MAQHSHTHVIDEDMETEIALRLRKADQRFTPARRALVAALVTAKGPMAIADILLVTEKMPQSSVYRNLTVLESVGVVSRLMSNDEYGRFELSENLIGHHHHLISTLAQLASANGFTLEHHRLDIVGKCSNCK
jgi:Fur family peroxide stress response transcriptional regulator